MTELLGLHPDLLDLDDLSALSLRLVLDLIFTSIVVLLVYVRRYGKNEYVFTYFMFNLVTFTLCFLLRKVPIELGFALGLFAVFGILRYRTEPIRTQDLTYLFVVIGLAILNAVVNKKVSLAELLLVNSSIVALTALLETSSFYPPMESRAVLYDNMEILRMNDEQVLIEDLRTRTGLDVQRVKILRIDLLRDTASLTVFFPNREQE
ncbi:MAG: DUF4956 domain-containing protein [Myxococcota bacterium]|jgi:hypothetical protein|nr:DUF4956 domain-containing protein [Myxococcota bacterium]